MCRPVPGRGLHLTGRKVQCLRRGGDLLFGGTALLRQDLGDVPYVGSGSQSGAPTGGAVPEGDARVVSGVEPFPHSSLGHRGRRASLPVGLAPWSVVELVWKPIDSDVTVT